MPLDHNKFQQFMVNIGAARQLLVRAHGKGALIEGVILYCSEIDALLRQLLLIERSVKARKTPTAGNVDIPDGFVWQDDEDPKFSERAIIRIARDEGVITGELSHQLNQLYDERNRVVHRYILSFCRYSDLEPILGEYELVFQKLYKRLEEYERPDLHELSDEQMSEMLERLNKKF